MRKLRAPPQKTPRLDCGPRASRPPCQGSARPPGGRGVGGGSPTHLFAFFRICAPRIRLCASPRACLESSSSPVCGTSTLSPRAFATTRTRLPTPHAQQPAPRVPKPGSLRCGICSAHSAGAATAGCASERATLLMAMGISFFTREPDSPSFMGFTCLVRMLTPSTRTCFFFMSTERSLPTVPCGYARKGGPRASDAGTYA